MPVNVAARLTGEHDNRLWRGIRLYVEEARNREDFSEVKKVGIDETSSSRGHKYIKVLWISRREGCFLPLPAKIPKPSEHFVRISKSTEGGW